MSFGDVIRSAYLPPIILYNSDEPRGVGGDANVIWFTDRDVPILYELSTVDFSMVMYNNWPWILGGVNPWGIGGTPTVVWFVDFSWAEVYELSPVDLSIIRKASAPTALPLGCGGDASLIWNICDSGTGERIYELSVIDFSVSRSGPPMLGDPRGIGGKSNVIWMAMQSLAEVYEMSTSDFSYVRTAPSPGPAAMGIGGDADTIYHVDDATNYIYELDSSALYTISGNVKDSNGNNLSNVTITLEDSTNYSTSTDTNGNYSQEVNADVYTVTASKSSYISSSTSVDATTSSQTQNFVLSRPVISGNIKDNKGYNINGVIVIFTDDTSYETTTDSDGNYSQEVDPDEYSVAASLTGYLPDSADVDASSSDQTQDFILNRTTAPHDKGILLESRELVQHNI